MTNYNDGKWHGHNGGKRPVHPKTVVECAYIDGEMRERDAEDIRWSATEASRPIAFRVIKEHKEPREFWVRYNEDGSVSLIGNPIDNYHAKLGETIKVREVLE